jgi:cephalosporin hydroxylase
MIYTEEDFYRISEEWLRAGWDTKYVYGFTWLGRPIIQLPEDMIRVQEVIYRVKPDIIIETGIAHGGSLIFYASLLRLINNGYVIGIDVDIREHNFQAIRNHEINAGEDIIMIEGSSIDEKVIAVVDEYITSNPRVMVILDSCHKKDHVLAELRAYSKFVSVGSYIVACDGIAKDMAGAPRTTEDWSWDNPQEAVKEFLAENDNFVMENPPIPFNEGEIKKPVTYWKNGYIRRLK